MASAITMCKLATAKKALRKQTAAALGALQAPALAAQSAAVLTELKSIPSFASTRCASIYLPMDGGREVDTWPILAALLSSGVKVAVPRVEGPNSTDMRMLCVSSYEQAAALPRTKWGIPEPDDELAARMEDMTGATFDLLLVPGVAFDARCNRLGHGRGYYDCFVSRQRALRREGALTVVGLALAPQLVDTVPTTETDERLDLVVHPDGRLAYASSDDLRAAARKRAASPEDEAAKDAEEGPEEDDGVDDAPVGLDERVDLAKGTWKYVCLRVTPPGAPAFLAVRSAPGNYHADVAEPAIAKFEASGYAVKALGGGRVKLDERWQTVHIYGYSVGLGGDEGGPPGRGMRDHSEAAALVRRRLQSYTVTYSADGY